MENASKALIIASTILLTLLIISVAVALFNSFGGSSREIMSEIEKSQIAEFNSQFLKYSSTNPDEGITAHDVVTLINLAITNNKQHEVEDQTGSINSNYVRIDYRKRNTLYTNVEKEQNFIKIGYGDLTNFLRQNYDKIYDNNYNFRYPYYIENIEVSGITKRVWRVVIAEK